MKTIEDGYDDEHADLIPKASGKQQTKAWMISLLIASNVCTFILSSQLQRWLQPSTTTGQWKQATQPGIDNDQHPTTFTGLKYIPNNFTALPGGDIDVDAAWASIGTYSDRFLISSSEAPSFPEITDSAMFLKPSSILTNLSTSFPANGGYPVFIEAFHQLHCVDLMRQALYFNHPFYSARGEGVWRSEEFWIRNHVNHCMDYLRRLAMCHAETGVITFSWRNEKGEYMLDYEQEKRCGNFEKVLDWAREHEVDLNGGDLELRPPEGAVFKELKGS